MSGSGVGDAARVSPHLRPVYICSASLLGFWRALRGTCLLVPRNAAAVVSVHQVVIVDVVLVGLALPSVLAVHPGVTLPLVYIQTHAHIHWSQQKHHLPLTSLGMV